MPSNESNAKWRSLVALAALTATIGAASGLSLLHALQSKAHGRLPLAVGGLALFVALWLPLLALRRQVTARHRAPQFTITWFVAALIAEVVKWTLNFADFLFLIGEANLVLVLAHATVAASLIVYAISLVALRIPLRAGPALSTTALVAAGAWLDYCVWARAVASV